MANYGRKSNNISLPSGASSEEGNKFGDGETQNKKTLQQIRGCSMEDYPQRCQESENAWIEQKSNATTLTNDKTNDLTH